MYSCELDIRFRINDYNSIKVFDFKIFILKLDFDRYKCKNQVPDISKRKE